MKALLTLLRQALPPPAWERGENGHLKHVISTTFHDAETRIFPAGTREKAKDFLCRDGGFILFFFNLSFLTTSVTFPKPVLC